MTNITLFILFLDIRFCDYKLSIVSASAVFTFFSCQSLEYSQTYKDKVLRLVGYIGKVSCYMDT